MIKIISDSTWARRFAAWANGASIRQGAVALLALPVMATASPGDLDTTYGNAGHYTSTAGEEVYASLVQPDNKLVLAGRCQPRSGAWNFCVSRLTTGGVLDTSFGAQPTPSGRNVFVAGDAGSANERAVSISRLPDGRLIVAGECTLSSASQWCVVRLNSNGSIDTSFGSGGRAYIPVASGIAASGPLTLTTVKALADGKILLAGNWSASLGQPRLLVMRLTANGAPDTSFGAPNGYAILTPLTPTSGDFRVNALTVRPDNRIIAAGHCERLFHSGMPSYFTSEACLWFLNADGSPDTSLPGGNNFSIMNISGSTGALADNYFTAISMRGDGTVIAVGTCGTTSASRNCYSALNLAQLSSSSGSGSSSDRASTNAMAIAADGRVLFLSTITLTASTGTFAVGTMAADLSGTFFGSGSVPSPSAGGYNSADAGGGLQSDGKILLAGNCGTSTLRACATRIIGFPVNAASCSLDLDGDGSYNALIDGLIANRVMLGLSGSAVTNGISFPASAVRTNWIDLRLYLVGQCGMPLP